MNQTRDEDESDMERSPCALPGEENPGNWGLDVLVGVGVAKGELKVAMVILK